LKIGEEAVGAGGASVVFAPVGGSDGWPCCCRPWGLLVETCEGWGVVAGLSLWSTVRE